MFFLKSINAGGRSKSALEVVKARLLAHLSIEAHSLRELLPDLLFKYEAFSRKSGRFMADKATILSYELTMSELLKVFGEEGCLSKVSLKRKSVTPEKRQKRIKFAQVSPKAELMPTFVCEYCPKKFGYPKKPCASM